MQSEENEEAEESGDEEPQEEQTPRKRGRHSLIEGASPSMRMRVRGRKTARTSTPVRGRPSRLRVRVSKAYEGSREGSPVVETPATPGEEIGEGLEEEEEMEEVSLFLK
jgi:hypothetical protein